MAQLFRDQCRDAWQAGGNAGLIKLWLRTLPDIFKTSVKEQLTSNERNSFMKYFNPKNVPTILLILSLTTGVLSFQAIKFESHAGFMLLIIASALCNVAKAGTESFRPSSEWYKNAIRTFILMFVYAIFMPAWAKLKLQAAADAPAHDPFGMFIISCLFANPVVTAIKFGQFLVQRKKS
jgi:hypothetical protein